MKYIKTILGASVIAASSVFAQTAPDATVVDGNLVIDNGDGTTTTIEAPQGSVDPTTGALTIGETTIEAPTATLLGDGSLELADGTVLPVPELPGGDAMVEWWNGSADEIVQYDATLDPSAPQLWFNYYLKAMYNFADDSNVVWFRELGGFFSVAVSGSDPAGVWMYGFDFPEAGMSTWAYFSNGNFTRLASGGARIEGWIYLAGTGFDVWYRCAEFDTDPTGVDARGTYLFGDGIPSYRLTTQP